MLTERYTPPRNAVTELFKSTPPELRDAMIREVEKITDDAAKWPNAPYHYGMGRIKAYEEWLARLSEKDRKAEIAASRVRYENHYQRVADLVVDRMNELGHDLVASRPPHERKRERGRGYAR